MCEYIKDDGEQCGATGHDGPFCHHHEDTRFAALWHRSGRHGGMTLARICDDCGARVRRAEQMRKHPNYGNRYVIEATLECDCSNHVLGQTTASGRYLPDGWV